MGSFEGWKAGKPISLHLDPSRPSLCGSTIASALLLSPLMAGYCVCVSVYVSVNVLPVSLGTLSRWGEGSKGHTHTDSPSSCSSSSSGCCALWFVCLVRVEIISWLPDGKIDILYALKTALGFVLKYSPIFQTNFHPVYTFIEIDF